MSIKICIVEDNRGLRESLAMLLDQAPGLACVGAYASGEAAVREIPLLKPDVALLDINLPGMNGIECVTQLRERLPKLQVLMLTRFEESDTIFNALRAGASGYILKNTPSDELLEAIHQVHASGAPMSMRIARKVIDYFHQFPKAASELEKLTTREQEVLAQLAKGCMYKEIADNLGITINTLRNHLRATYEKLHVHSRTEATVKYLAH